jgi:hypothetical protein
MYEAKFCLSKHIVFYGCRDLFSLVIALPCLTNLSKENYVKENLQIRTVCFVPPSNEKRAILLE